MATHMKKYLLPTLLILSAIISGCEKGIDIKLNQASDLLVVDASIENGQPPIVILSRSFNYFSKISPDLLAASFVHDAQISITSGSQTVKLKEYSYPSGPFRLYLYTIDTTQPAQRMIGQVNATYVMNIAVNGKTYNAQTTIPALTKKVDSIWAKPAPNNKDTLKRVLFAKVYDPPGLGNYIRYYTSVNDSAFLPGRNSVYNDDITDGKTFDIQIDKGVDVTKEAVPDEEGFFRKGDTVQLKFCNIDKATYDFWSTLEYSQQAIGNPFSQPVKILGNISNGALGCFSGFSSQFKKIIISK